MVKNIIYPDNWEGYGKGELEEDGQGFRASYYYMHGNLELDSGYDCFNVSGNLLVNLLSEGIFIAKCFRNNKTCLVFSCYDGNDRMIGRACYIDDLDAIRCITVNQLEKGLSVRFTKGKDFVKDKYIETYNLLKELSKK